MDDTNTQSALTPRVREPKADTPKDYATLKRGSNYALKFDGKIERFENGTERPVSAKLKAYLEETAKDIVTVSHGDNENESETRPKFEFDRR